MGASVCFFSASTMVIKLLCFVSILFLVATVRAGVLNGGNDPGEPLTPKNFEDAWSVPNDNDDEELSPNMFEGDIQLSQDERELLEKEGVKGLMREVINTDTKKWPKDSDGYVRIPYKIQSGFRQEVRDNLARVILEFQGKTCIRLVPWSGQQRNYIEYSREYDDFGAPCSSPTGMQYYVNSIRLGNQGHGCNWGSILHETMHSLGFFHEHTRQDRDDYVKINWDKAGKDGLKSAFTKCTWVPEMQIGCRPLKTSYDYDSIMHYGNKAGYFEFLQPLHGAVVGQRNHLSVKDIQGIEEFYGCSPGMGDPTVTYPPTTTLKPTEAWTESSETLRDRCRIWANMQLCSMVDWHCPECGVE